MSPPTGAAAAAWLDRPTSTAAIGVAVVLALLAMHHGSLWQTAPLGDEAPYLCGFRAAAAGTSPYACPRFLYPPAFAHLGAAFAGLGDLGLLRLLRICNLLALAVLLSASVPATGLGLLLALALSLGAPPIAEALQFGNLSPWAAATAMLTLRHARERPALAGLACAASLAVKPIAWIVPLAVLVDGRARGRRLLLFLLPAAAGAGLHLLWPAQLVEWLSLPAHVAAHHNLSLSQLASSLGLPQAKLLPALVAAALCLAWLGRGRYALTPAGLLLCVLGSPVVWNHTLVLLLPAILEALHRLIDDARRPHEAKLRARTALLWLSCCAALLGSDVFGVMGPPLAMWLNLVPLAAAVMLTRSIARRSA